MVEDEESEAHSEEEDSEHSEDEGFEWTWSAMHKWGALARNRSRAEAALQTAKAGAGGLSWGRSWVQGPGPGLLPFSRRPAAFLFWIRKGLWVHTREAQGFASSRITSCWRTRTHELD
jgi:hypothetical protein